MLMPNTFDVLSELVAIFFILLLALQRQAGFRQRTLDAHADGAFLLRASDDEEGTALPRFYTR